MDEAGLGEFPVLEFRRYRISPEEREHFAHYFDSYFPEAIQQAGALVLGQFLERGNVAGFTWIRGFRDMEGRAAANTALYDGAVWKEHRTRMNEHMLDHTNVLLLHPVCGRRGLTVLPSVDPVREARSARGVIAAQVFAVNAGAVEEFLGAAESAFSAYRSSSVREVGVLRSLDVANNYPRLPFRTDGPYVVWLGMIENDAALRDRFQPAAEAACAALDNAALLRGPPELIVMDPTARSRLRWLPPV